MKKILSVFFVGILYFSSGAYAGETSREALLQKISSAILESRQRHQEMTGEYYRLMKVTQMPRCRAQLEGIRKDLLDLNDVITKLEQARKKLLESK